MTAQTAESALAADAPDVTASAPWTPRRVGRLLRTLLPSGTALPDSAFEPRHRVVTYLLWAHAVVLPLVALGQGRALLLVLGIAALVSSFALAASASVLSRLLRASVGASGLMICSSVVVALWGGQIEAHFHFFVMIPVVALYEHWVPFSLAVGYVLFEHGVVGTLAPAFIYDHSGAHEDPWTWAGVHAAFFAASCVGALANWRLAERARETESALAEEMGQRARLDSLTGLPNRAALLEEGALRIAEATGTGGRTAVLLIDLDRFKEVNDTLGHAWGDGLLCLVSERLRGRLSRDGMVARLGGDEFAVLLPGCDRFGAVTVAEEMRAALAEGFSLAGLQLEVDSSFGVAVHLHSPVAPGGWSAAPDTVMADLLRCADIAMYTAKTGHTGVHVYDPAEDARSRDRLTVLSDLRSALTGDELVLHFQPKIRVGDGEVVGAEALVRWQHPRRGLLQPGDFVPMVEQTALITPMTAVVLELAVRQARQLLDRGHRLQIAVNVSTRSLRDQGFVNLVLRTLARYDLPGELLRLEITETSLMTDPASAMDVLHQLAARGVGLSIDDFGTGYSSMSYLRQLPVDELKVDRSFVTALRTAGPGGSSVPGARLPMDIIGEIATRDRSSLADDAVLVRSAVELGHNLGMSVVAEGVETLQALEVLAELGCDDAQGYHIARPMPAAALLDMLEGAPAPAPAASPAVETVTSSVSDR